MKLKIVVTCGRITSTIDASVGEGEASIKWLGLFQFHVQLCTSNLAFTHKP